MQIHFDDRGVRIMDAEGREVFRSRIFSRRTESGVVFWSEDRLREEIPEGTVELSIPGIDDPIVTRIGHFVSGSHFECALSDFAI